MKPVTHTILENAVSFTDHSNDVDYSVSNNGMVFSIMSQGLYSNKIAACIKEPISNAIDSHQEAGKPEVPVSVHLPTALEPHFSVRDYGVSMTEERVYDVFCVAGESTKTKTDQKGGFGIGGISPWAYTDIFNITVFLDGERRVYTNNYNNRSPKLTQIVSEPTDEPNGVEISFPVDKDHCEAFLKCFRIITQFMAVRPETNMEIDYADHWKKHDWFSISDRAHLNIVPHSCEIKQVYVTVGDIPYPIDGLDFTETLMQLSDREGYNWIRPILRNNTVVIHASVDDVDVLPSREKLDFKSLKTESFILSALKGVSNFYSEYEKELHKHAPFKNMKHAYKIAKEIFSDINLCSLEHITVEYERFGEIKFTSEAFYQAAISSLRAVMRAEQVKVNTAFKRYINSKNEFDRVYINSESMQYKNALPPSATSYESKKETIYAYIDNETASQLSWVELGKLCDTHSIASVTFVTNRAVFEEIKSHVSEKMIIEYEKASADDVEWLESDRNKIEGYIPDSAETLKELLGDDIRYRHEIHYEAYRNNSDVTGIIANRCKYVPDIKRVEEIKYIIDTQNCKNRSEVYDYIISNDVKFSQVAFTPKNVNKISRDPMVKKLGMIEIASLVNKQKVMEDYNITENTKIFTTDRKFTHVIVKSDIFSNAINRHHPDFVIIREKEIETLVSAGIISGAEDLNLRNEMFDDLPGIDLARSVYSGSIRSEKFDMITTQLLNALRGLQNVEC